MQLHVSKLLASNRVAAAALAAIALTAATLVPGPGLARARAASQAHARLLATSAAAVPPAPIGHAGRWLTDADGRVLLVTGVNMVNKLAPYAPDADGFGADDAAFLAANGFDAVRLGVIWKAVEPEPGVFDDSYLARIAATVNLLGSYGIVSLLDFHQDMYNEEFQGEGAPDWAVDTNGLVAFPELGFPANYFLQPALQTAYDNFWANTQVDGEGLQDWYAGAWQHVAAYFAGHQNLLGYDIYNEPFPGSNIWGCLVPAVGCPAQDAVLTAFDKKVTTAIRNADPDTMIFSEPWFTYDVGYPTSLGATGDPHAGFSFHDYCPFASIAALYGLLCPSFNTDVFSNADTHSSQTGDALLLTEFGATDDTSVLSSVVADAAQYKVGWLVWAYCGCGDPTTTGSASAEAIVYNPELAPTGSNVDQAVLDALAVPHPELVAGTPLSYGYDTSSSTFTLAYSTDRAAGTGEFAAGSDSTVTVPAVQYPSGYQVVVSGAKVVSEGGTLTLASCSGATKVTLTVEPGSGVTNGC